MSETEQRQKLMRLSTAVIFFAVGLAVLGFLVYRVVVVMNWQLDTTANIQMPLAVLIIVISVVSFELIRRGRAIPGTILLFALTLSSPLAAALAIEKGGIASGFYIALASAAMIAWVLPKSLTRGAAIFSAAAIIFIVAVEILNPPFRVNANIVPNYPILVAVFTGLIIFPLFAIQMWTSGRLRNRIIALMIVVLLPIQIIFSFLNVQAQQRDLEQSLLDRTKSVAVVGATTIGKSLEDAIANGNLTAEQVFDQNYVNFYTFDPSQYPELTDDPRIYDKYRTAYDAYTDENWQNILDSHLGDPDILYATVSDVNGYVPTHNRIFSTGDGNPATDRTKRIFSDEIGIKAARNTLPVLQQIYLQTGTGATLWDISSPIYVNGKHWGAFRVGVQLGQNQTRVQDATLRAVTLSSILLVLVAVFAWFLGNYITGPIERLTKASQAAASGDLGTRIEIPGRDEITILADSFTQMTSQLRNFIGSLEQRVVERTKALETSLEVSRRLSAATSPRQLAVDVVEQVQAAFGYYHAHIYFFDEQNENLVMVGGTGEAGAAMLASGHSIPKGRGLVGRAAETNEAVLVEDVTHSIGWLPNPLLPDTKSEAAVPIAVGSRVLGVLDVQQNIVNGLGQNDIVLLQSLASQVAISLQNARAYEQSRAQAELESKANLITQKIQRAATMEEVLQIAIREVGQALGASRVRARIGIDSTGPADEARQN